MVELKGQPHLMTQDASTVDPSKLTALTPEVVSLVVLYLFVVLLLCLVGWGDVMMGMKHAVLYY